jgi:hypothetical protein
MNNEREANICPLWDSVDASTRLITDRADMAEQLRIVFGRHPQCEGQQELRTKGL